MISVLMGSLTDSSNKANICHGVAVVLYHHPKIILSDKDLITLVNLLHFQDDEVVGAALNLLNVASYEQVPEILFEYIEANRLVMILNSSNNEETKLRCVQLIDKIIIGDHNGQLRNNFVNHGVIQSLLGSLGCSKLGKCSADVLTTLCSVQTNRMMIRRFLAMNLIILNALGKMEIDPEMHTSAINLKRLIHDEPGIIRQMSFTRM
eukprot:NODE_4048_length_1239_cov_35.834229_g3556_i0.p1 GENE.NODE_4048_length_1239_cov_35.834229_g3556_i0~~NODE_4048_length_1239_cov_35.834229_g3556_i0.p1  ORF type:complete len:207 (-),score=-4.28 NODE_4048_length_1239_cov_35.834229_g3556_i0:259-879(-)